MKTKHPSESYFEKVLPFSQSQTLRDSFVNIFGDLRFGMLLEELDKVAGLISYEHCDGHALGLTIVTAACDRIDLLAPLPSNSDLRISGQVNFVGRTSMEIGVLINTLSNGNWLLVARAYFIMVARKDGLGFPIHRLATSNDDEVRRAQEGFKRQSKRSADKSLHFSQSAPSAEESQLLHRLFLDKPSLHEGIPMHDTWRQSTMIMHPQDRNIHNKIFGGYIMRMSFETAYNVAHLFCRRRPLFVCVDHFDFIKPVEIGSIVSFNGLVTFTGRTSFIVEVSTEVIRPMDGKCEITNVSYFTFVAVEADCKPTPVLQVFPHSYEEGLKYLDGAKRYRNGKAELAVRNQPC